MEDNTLKNLNYLICKCHARVLQEQHDEFAKMQNELSDMQIDNGKADGNQKQVKFDNLYDLLFNDAGKPKENLTKKLVFNQERLDFLENFGQNIQIVDTVGQKKTVEIDKLKITKQFKLVNPVPKFQSVPATPQFFDLAGAHISYPNLDEPMGKYKVQGGGLFKKITGLFGR